MIDLETQQTISLWLEGDYDPLTKERIRTLQRENPQELTDAFYTHLEFGTGGLRAIMDVGTNRMNVYTVRTATQGLANYLLKQSLPPDIARVLIGYDCRHQSRLFAEEAAQVLAANGIEVLLYKELRPVALVSFGVVYKQCTAGILITASHNPPQYNGYKVYWGYGGQVLPPHDQAIMEEMQAVSESHVIQRASLPHPRVTEVNGEIDRAYLDALRPWQLQREQNQHHGKELKVVYSNLHGSGITIVPHVLSDWGFSQFFLIEEQVEPDGDFPTVRSPNPEEHATLKLGVQKLKHLQGDLLLATDPDSDRLGVVVLQGNEPYFFDGNQIAALLLEHLCLSLHETAHMPLQPICVKTIVTSELVRAIALRHGVECLDVLTGFKYVGEKIYEWERTRASGQLAPQFIFGAEESYGYLLGTHARDKDAMVAAASLCEAALLWKLRGKTLVDALYALYEKYGVYREGQVSLTRTGKEGVQEIERMMEQLRHFPPQEVSGYSVAVIEDYLFQTRTQLPSKKQQSLSLPRSNVLRFWLSDQTKIVVRPSGTEPKIKIYCGLSQEPPPIGQQAIEQALHTCDARLKALLSSMESLLRKALEK